MRRSALSRYDVITAKTPIVLIWLHDDKHYQNDKPVTISTDFNKVIDLVCYIL